MMTAIGLLGAGAVACSSSQHTARAQATSAEISAAGSPDLRAVDNSGYVGPAGQTRTVTQGMGPSTIGRGEGVAPPQRENVGAGQVAPASTGADPPPPPMVTSPSDPAEAMERATRAACDRETYCEHVGPGRAYGSADACMAEKRTRIQRSAPAKACTKTVSGDRLGACLTAIRAVACGVTGASTPTPPECSAAALCGAG